MTTLDQLIAAICEASEELDRRRARLEQWMAAHAQPETVTVQPEPTFARTRTIAEPSRYVELRNRKLLILK